jgi:hypothetical protein
VFRLTLFSSFDVIDARMRRVSDEERDVLRGNSRVNNFSFANAMPVYRVGATVASHHQTQSSEGRSEAHPLTVSVAFLGCRQRAWETPVR